MTDHPLIQLRLARKLSRRELAVLVGTSRQTIYRIEKGEQIASPGLVKKLLAQDKSGYLLRAEHFLPRDEVAA